MVLLLVLVLVPVPVPKVGVGSRKKRTGLWPTLGVMLVPVLVLRDRAGCTKNRNSGIRLGLRLSAGPELGEKEWQWWGWGW